MASPETGDRPSRLPERMLERLAARWPVVVAAVIAIAVLAAAAGGEWPVAAVAIAFVLAVALVVPRSTHARPGEAERQAADGDGFGTLRAADLAAAVPDPLYLFDRDGTIIYANPAAVTAFGETPAGIALQLKFRAPEMQELIRQVLAGEAASAPVDYTERVPVERVYRVSVMPVGRVAGLFVLFFRDQSETRRIDRMRADFIANASHELRTPLASVAGFIETLRGPARDDAGARDNFLQIMQNQTARMARLIDDLLSLSRLEMKPYLRPDERVDIRALLEGVVESLALQAKEAGASVERDLPDGPVEVPGNRDELVQVFENLLENAYKYGGDGGRVIVSLEREEGARGKVAVAIRDFGPGIPGEHIPRITERFYRVDVETSRAQKGTGLGLSIVKHILSRHDARLTVESAVGEGSTFTVRFPR